MLLDECFHLKTSSSWLATAAPGCSEQPGILRNAAQVSRHLLKGVVRFKQQSDTVLWVVRDAIPLSIDR